MPVGNPYHNAETARNRFLDVIAAEHQSLTALAAAIAHARAFTDARPAAHWWRADCPGTGIVRVRC